MGILIVADGLLGLGLGIAIGMLALVVFVKTLYGQISIVGQI